MNKINILFTFCLIWIASVQISAQQVSFEFAPSAITAAVGDEIDVEVRVGNGFTNLIGLQFGLNYNGAALEYISHDNSPNPLGGDYSVAKRPNKSELINVWAFFSFGSVSLDPGTLLYTVKFKVLTDIGNSIDILCGDGEVGCEFSTEALEKFDDIVVDQTADINGGGPSQNVGPINVALSTETATTGSQSCVQFAVSDFVDILSMQFSIQYDESVLSYSGPLQNLDNCPDDPPSSVSNPLCLEAGNFNLFEPGTLTFSFSDFGSGNSFTLDDGTVILDLCFDVIGAGGTSSDIVIDGTPTFIQVIKQGEGNENFGLNSNTGSITVSGGGGPLDVVTYTIGNAGGDTGTNVCVPVTVNDGFDDILGFGWSVDYDATILDYTVIQNVAPALSSVGANEPTPGTLSFIWNAPFTANSEVTLADETVLFEMCFNVIGNSGQMSPLTFTNSPNPIETVKIDGPDDGVEQDLTLVNTTNGNVTVTNSDGFNLIVCEADVCTNDQVCVPILATGATEIASLGFTLEYDVSVLSYSGFDAVDNIRVNEPVNNLGHINVIYISFSNPPVELNLEDCEQLGEFCFDVIGATGTSTAISITSDPTEFQASVIGDAGFPEEIAVASTDGAVNVDCSGTAGMPIIECACGDMTEPLMVDQNASVVEDITCNGDQDGSIILSVTGGEMPITYSWSNGQTTKDLINLGPGNYTVDVTDNAGTMVNAMFTINEPTALAPNSSAMNTSTPTATDGSISLNVSGGTAPYTYSWTGGETTATITGLAPNTYNVTITDANSCSIVTSRTVGPKLTIAPSGGPGSPAGTTIITDIVCFGENTGSIDLAITGGVAPLSISWNTGSNQSSLSGLAAGNYCVTILDTNGDQEEACYDVQGPAAAINITGNVAPQTLPGANDGSIVLTVTGGDTPYTYNWNGPNVNNITTKDINNLTEGNYVVNVTDARGCVRSFTFFLETAGEALAINAGATQVANVRCFGENNGAINPSVTGGATPYSFSWSGPNNYSSTSGNISGLEPGSYQLTVTDNTGATAESVLFLVSEPSAPLSVSAQITEESAPGQNDGGIDLTVAGGTPGYSFNWSNFNPNEDNFALTSGTYSVTITDARGCTIEDSFSVTTDADPLVINAQGSTVNNVRCFGDLNGSISPVVNGGFPPYSFDWGAQGTDRDISGLAAGEYTLTVTDQNGLTDIQTFLVQSPTQINIVLGAVTPESSNGDDGGIQVTVSGGTPNYTYAWTGPNGYFSTSEDITNLTEGTYTLNVTDANGCQAQRIVSLGAVLSIENKFEIDVDCFEECTGEIDIVVVGGQPPYLYSWTGPDGFVATTQDIDELCAGVYNATISDAAGQQVFSTCRIDEPLLGLTIGNNPIIIDEIVPNTGSINITVNGGTPPYTYQWSNQEPSEDITNLLAGSYRVTVTDANGCLVISPDYIVERIPTDINVENLIENDPTCNGDCNGSISLQIVGGDAPYTLTWNDQGSQTLSSMNPVYSREDMCAGEYTLTIVDANGNDYSQAIVLEDLPAITIDAELTHEINGNDGTINTTVTGGQAPYTYNWAPNTLPSTPDQENLSAGLYIVTVTDANDCTEIESFVIEDNVEPLVIEEPAVINQIDCFGDMNGSIDITVTGGVQPYNFLWSNNQVTEDAIGLGAGSFTVTVTDGAGVQRIGGPYLINAPEEITATITTELASSDGECDARAEATLISGGQAPYTYLWESDEDASIALSLCVGTQNVTITDALGCSVVIEFTINSFDSGAPTNDFTIDHVDCNGNSSGSISVQTFGGFGGFTYMWSTGDETQNIGNLLPGVYFLTTTDANGIEYVDGPLEITEPDPITINFNVMNETGMGTADGKAEAIVTGGTAPYTYQWNNPVLGGCNTFDCDGLTAGTYFVVVQDAEECIQVDSVVIGNDFGGECQMTRNIITPDEDGKNDSFLIQCAPGSINTLEIYNRWGQLVFLADNYDNTWEGTNRRGQDLPAGGYFYVFLLEDATTGETIPYQGHITILRQ